MLLVRTRLGASPIQGLGLFADEFIPKGTIVWEFVPGFDLAVAPEDLARLSMPALSQFRKYSYLDRNLGKYVLCFDDARFMNHAEQPNLDDVSAFQNGMGVTIAARDIFPGDELTCDYSTFDAEWGTYSFESENGRQDTGTIGVGAPAS
jgi:SET domain-containing protein